MAERECLAPARSGAAASGRSGAKRAAAAGACVLARDIGGTKLAAALADPHSGQAGHIG